MNRNKKSLTSLKEIITSILDDSRLPFNPNDARIWEIWDEVVGSAIAKNAQPSWIKNGRLRISVADPIWQQELNFVKETIKDKLNKKLGRTAVEKIDFRLRQTTN